MCQAGQFFGNSRLLWSSEPVKRPMSKAVIKIDLDEQEVIVAGGLLDKNKEYTHATVWKIPNEKEKYTTVSFSDLEHSIVVSERERDSYGYSARFEINRITLEGDYTNMFDLGICNSGILPSSNIMWKSGEIIEEEEYRQLFNKIKLKDDEITQNFEERTKAKKF